MPSWWRSGVTVALLPMAAVAACTGGDSPGELPPGQEPPAATPATVAASTASTAGSPRGQVLASYLRYWDAVIAAHRAADPRSAGLAEVAADPQLTEVRQTVDRNRIQHVSVRGEVTHRPDVRAVGGGTATVEDCYDISDWDPVDARTGEAIEVSEEGGTGRYRARYTLRRTGTSWLVTTESILGSC